jgi:hypothetical protein
MLDHEVRPWKKAIFHAPWCEPALSRSTQQKGGGSGARVEQIDCVMSILEHQLQCPNNNEHVKIYAYYKLIMKLGKSSHYLVITVISNDRSNQLHTRPIVFGSHECNNMSGSHNHYIKYMI